MSTDLIWSCQCVKSLQTQLNLELGGVMHLYSLYIGEGGKRPFYANFEFGLNFYDLFRSPREWKKSLNGNTDTALNIVTWISTSMKLHQDTADRSSKFEMHRVSGTQLQLIECQYTVIPKYRKCPAESKFHIDKLVFYRKICKMYGIFIFTWVGERKCKISDRLSPVLPYD